MEANVVILSFVIGSTLPTDSNTYLILRSDSDEEPLPNFVSIEEISKELPAPNKSKLFYYINRPTNVDCLCIPPSMTPNGLVVAYGKGYLGFSCYYKIITCFWFIHGFMKLFCIFIYHCP